MHRTLLWKSVALVALASLYGCAARGEPATPEAPEPPAGTSAPSSIEPTPADDSDIDALEAALARDDDSLRSLFASTDTAQPGEAQAPVTTPPKTTAGAPSAGSVELESIENRCDRACRALSSMRRSAEGICRLSGDDTDRCQRAQSRVDAAQELVRGAGCAC